MATSANSVAAAAIPLSLIGKKPRGANKAKVPRGEPRVPSSRPRAQKVKGSTGWKGVRVPRGEGGGSGGGRRVVAGGRNRLLIKPLNALPPLPVDVVFPSGAEGGEGDSLPLGAVWRIMARVLPPRASIDVEAVHVVTACAGEFIAFLAAAVRESAPGVGVGLGGGAGASCGGGANETLGALGEIG